MEARIYDTGNGAEGAVSGVDVMIDVFISKN